MKRTARYIQAKKSQKNVTLEDIVLFCFRNDIKMDVRPDWITILGLSVGTISYVRSSAPDEQIWDFCGKSLEEFLNNLKLYVSTRDCKPHK